jgi:geranylgeranyl pyrophosphate synthase
MTAIDVFGSGQPEQEIILDLGFDREIQDLREAVSRWIHESDSEVREALRWQFLAGSKYFRPLTVFSCYRATEGEVAPQGVRSAMLLELLHNVSLVIDDIVDKSQSRRGRLTLHAEFGQLSALMTSGYIVADVYRMAAGDNQAIRLFSELFKRLAVAECLQWRLRRQPLGVEDWRRIAGEDTGSMFEVAACLGDRSERLRRFGGLLGLLYHGCDDVADVRGTTALGGGGYDDLRDGILTLPAALAILDPTVARMFCNPHDRDLDTLSELFQAQIPAAEAYLDSIAEEATQEATLFASNPDPLLALTKHTRRLSRR